MQALAKIGLVVVSTLSIVLPAQSVYMLGNPGWEPLTLDYLKAHNIDPSFMDEVLDGGGEFTCLRKRPDGMIGVTVLSAWFFDGDHTHVVTSAHAIYSPTDGLLRGHFEDCFVMTSRDAMVSESPERIPIDADLSHIMVSTEDPLGDFYDRDRALVPLIIGNTHPVKPIELQTSLIEQLVADDKVKSPLEVFMVSSGRPSAKSLRTHTSPRIQRGEVWSLDSPLDPRQPARAIIRVDWHKGDSASLLFIRNIKHPTQLVPFAILRGGAYRQYNSTGDHVDGLPFDPETNNAQAILLDGKFMNFPLSIEQVPKSALPPKSRQNPE